MVHTPSGRRPTSRRIVGVLAAVVAGALALGVAVQLAPSASARDIHAPKGSKAITPARGTHVTQRFFGMHTSQLAHTFPSVPAGSVALMTDGVYWPDIETSDGVFDFTRLHLLVDQARQSGARPFLILGQTPAFHAAAGTTYTGLNSVPDKKAWKRYVRAVVDEFGSQLDYQLWPEPNVKPNWIGTPQQLADLVVAAAKIIHGSAPRAVVVAPGMMLRLRFERVFMKRFFAAKVRGVPVGRYVDAVGLDPYPREEGTPEDALALIQQARRFLRNADVRAPIWTVEINYGNHVGGIGDAEHAPWSRQASWVARTYLLSAGVGVQRVFWLGWGSYRNLDVQMVDPDTGQPTPAADGYARVARWLTGQRARGCFHHAARDLYSCAFVRDGHTSWAYWTGSGRTRVFAPAGARHLQAATGDETSRVHRGDRIRVTTVPRWVTS